jgi:hypothetical protein
MQPFAVTRKEDFDAVREFHSLEWGTAGVSHINGLKENGIWYVRTPAKVPIYPAAVPTDQSKDCLIVNGTLASPKMESTSCSNSTFWGVCQWDLVSKAQNCSTSE